MNKIQGIHLETIRPNEVFATEKSINSVKDTGRVRKIMFQIPDVADI